MRLEFMGIWANILYLIIGVIVGGIAAFFISRKMFATQLKKNPPINEKMIRAI